METKFAGMGIIVWLGSIVVRTLDLQSTGRGFDSRPPHCRVATLGKSFTRAQRRMALWPSAVWRYRNLSNLILKM